MSAAGTTQSPTMAPLDGTDMPSGVRFVAADPCRGAGQSADIDQSERTIAKAAQNAIRIHAAPDDDLAWAAAAFHPM